MSDGYPTVGCSARSNERLVMANHPCFSQEAHKRSGRIHLPVAPECNIQCGYCVRKFDCVNESRPGVASTILTPPAVGDDWAGQGGIYAGLSLTDDGLHACHLILADTDRDLEHNWADAGAWTAGLDIDGHKDFTLPNRVDGIVLYRRLRDRFALNDWHWLSEQHAQYSDCAWVQYFTSGNQGNFHKSNEYRARAVRRLVI